MKILIVLLLLTLPACAKGNLSCLKKDGDWLEGVTKKQCKNIGGKWKRQ